MLQQRVPIKVLRPFHLFLLQVCWRVPVPRAPLCAGSDERARNPDTLELPPGGLLELYLSLPQYELDYDQSQFVGYAFADALTRAGCSCEDQNERTC